MRSLECRVSGLGESLNPKPQAEPRFQLPGGGVGPDKPVWPGRCQA